MHFEDYINSELRKTTFCNLDFEFVVFYSVYLCAKFNPPQTIRNFVGALCPTGRFFLPPICFMERRCSNQWEGIRSYTSIVANILGTADIAVKRKGEDNADCARGLM